MDPWLVLSGAGCVVALLLWLLWFRQATHTFSVDLPHHKDVLFDFLKVPSNLTQVHPTIEAVEMSGDQGSKLYFEVEENLGGLAGRKKVTCSLQSYSDVSTQKCYIRLENHNALVKVLVSLAISDCSPLAQLSSFSPHSSPPGDPSSPPSLDQLDQWPRTPPPSPDISAPPASSSSSLITSSAAPPQQQVRPRCRVQGRVQVTLTGGLAQLIARHVAHVWRTTLSNTDTLLARRSPPH
ncbi:hypothetical protein EGW08_018757 [Elysia chlorotica]|uniref:Uncharacterized protein n=1 Tax=Elysia chlorotica TaxID=188477 RepID=A0A3S1H6Z3_ELYCH|nr:hypothetical protein EGW08_018757 [Elysia chlorotica]